MQENRPEMKAPQRSPSAHRVLGPLLLAALLLPGIAQAWWNDHWSYRKQITIQTQPPAPGAAAAAATGTPPGTPPGATRAKPAGVPAGLPLLVRLHSGNFSYFLDLKSDAGDLRFLAADDKTPLKYSVEKFDPLNGIALIWVQAPPAPAGGGIDRFWMYYGNQDAGAGTDPQATYDVHQVAVYHFDNKTGAPRDATAYGNDAVRSAAAPDAASIIGAGARLSGKGGIVLPDSPSLRLGAAGFTLTAWLRVAQAQEDAYLFARSDTDGRGLFVGLDADGLYARIDTAPGASVATPHVAFAPGSWHQVAVTLGDGRLILYLDGAQAASVAAPAVEMGGPIGLGAAADGSHALRGEIDEVRLSNRARPPAWIAAAAADEAPGSTLLRYGGDEQNGGGSWGTSYFGTILRSVTTDGWVIITLLVLMGMVSFAVMAVKARTIRRTKAGNRRFVEAFERSKAAAFAAAGRSAGAAARAAPLPGVVRLTKGDATFAGSSLYRIYVAGINELDLRFGADTHGAMLRPQALQAIRARLDAALVREIQRLNNQMVLLTIAISGGPFLGLLGTVMGVMITFAAIAATGDVNINAIAPGIAAALVATVAGLAVAIPALFAYNYLMTRIKEIAADMRVFVDDFLGRIAEAHGE